MSTKEENMQKRPVSEKKKNSRRRAGIWLVAAVCVVLLVGGLAAKYITENRQQAEASSAQFHVTSDYLEEDGASYEITNWGDGFTVQLYNYEKENLALVSDADVSYKVKVTPEDKWECKECKDASAEHTLTGNGAMQTNTLTIQPKDGATIEQNDKVIVTVQTTAPFTKELSATFTVVSSKLPEQQLEQSSADPNQWHLIIKTNDYTGTVTVSWPKDTLCPDTTNADMNTWMNNGTASLVVQANTTYDLVFLSSKEGSSFKLASKSGAAVEIQ